MKKILLILFVLMLFFVYSFSNKQNSDIEKIKFSTWGSQSEIEILNNIISDFERENPDIKIELIHIPQNYFQKIHLLFASKLEPDIVFINNKYIQMYIKAGLLEDLSSSFPDCENAFYKEALSALSKDGKLYAVPRDISNLVIYYNKDIMKKYGIKLPLKINSIEQLKDIAIKITSESAFGINSEIDSLYWLYYLASNGGGAVSDDGKTLLINNDKSIQALNLYYDLVYKYHCAPTKAQIGSMTTAQMFINSKIGMYVSGRWMVPKFRETINFDWDVSEFPSSENGKVYIDASGWAISKNSKHKDSAQKFISYLSSKNSIDEFSKSGLIIPARIDSSNSPNFLNNNLKPLHGRVFTDMLQNSKPTPVNENYSVINDILNIKMQSILEGKNKPASVFDEKTLKKLESLL